MYAVGAAPPAARARAGPGSCQLERVLPYSRSVSPRLLRIDFKLLSSRVLCTLHTRAVSRTLRCVRAKNYDRMPDWTTVSHPPVSATIMRAVP